MQKVTEAGEGHLVPEAPLHSGLAGDRDLVSGMEGRTLGCLASHVEIPLAVAAEAALVAVDSYHHARGPVGVRAWGWGTTAAEARQVEGIARMGAASDLAAGVVPYRQDVLGLVDHTQEPAFGQAGASSARFLPLRFPLSLLRWAEAVHGVVQGVCIPRPVGRAGC